MLRRGTRRTRIRLAVFVGTALVALGAIVAGAWAITPALTATDDAFSSPTYTIDQGETPSFGNGGANQHNVTARQNGPDHKALFVTPTIGGGQSATLNGTQYLSAGSYTFFCTIHPTEMQATLVVTSNGTPQARPSGTLALRTNTISKAVKKGIQGTLTASTAISGVTVTAKLGKATIGKTSASLSPGPQTVKVKLTKAGKSKLSKKSSAKVTVSADIPFGSPATAKANLK